MNESSVKKNHNNISQAWFYFTISYIILDYTRIYQEFGLEFLRLLMINIIILFAYILYNRQYSFKSDKILYNIWLFILFLGLLIPFSANSFRAFETTKSMLLYMPFVLSIIACLNTIDRIRKFIIILFLIEIYVAVYSIFCNGYGPGNYFNDENDLSLYVTMYLPFCVFLFNTEKSLAIRIITIVGFFICIAAITISFSRGGFLGLAAYFFVSFIFSNKKYRYIMLLILVSFILIYFASDLYWNEMGTSLDAGSGTGKERIESWKSAYRMFLDKPFGVGGNNFQIWFPEYQTEYFYGRNMWGRVAHSVWLTLLTECGIIGTLLFIKILYHCAKYSLSLKSNKIYPNSSDAAFFNQLGQAYITSLFCFFVSASFLSVLYYAHFWYIAALIVATNIVSIKIKSSAVKEN